MNPHWFSLVPWIYEIVQESELSHSQSYFMSGLMGENIYLQQEKVGTSAVTVAELAISHDPINILSFSSKLNLKQYCLWDYPQSSKVILSITTRVYAAFPGCFEEPATHMAIPAHPHPQQIMTATMM